MILATPGCKNESAELRLIRVRGDLTSRVQASPRVKEYPRVLKLNKSNSNYSLPCVLMRMSLATPQCQNVST